MVPTQTHPNQAVPPGLLEAIHSFPREREVEHCGCRWVVSPFDIYWICPSCGARLKLRAFSALPEIEDVFDAVFKWLNQPGAEELAKHRRKAIAEEPEDE